MLEKDIENLLVKYPNEFLSKYSLTVKGQQVKLGTYYADVVFEDKSGDMVIAEIKRGILRRDALGQAIEYYGLLKKKEPNKDIKLMLIANVIPEGMTAFLNEKLGVEFVEIPVSKIKSVAAKHSYRFLDAIRPEQIKEYKQTVDTMGLEAETAQRRVWIFQANPERYDVLNALADESLIDDTWLVSRYQNEIRRGHVGLIWMSGREGGVFAVVDITSNPQMMVDSEQSTKYWLEESDQRQMKLRVTLRYRLRLLNNPLLREEVKNNPILASMEIFRRPIGTNFKVSNNEWQAILDLLKKRQ